MEKRLAVKAQHPPVNDKTLDEKREAHEAIVEFDDGEVTEQMRIAYRRFWHLVIGRVLEEGVDP